MIELRPVLLAFYSHFDTDDSDKVKGYVLEEKVHLVLELHTALGTAGTLSVDLTDDERDILDQLLSNITGRAKKKLNE